MDEQQEEEEVKVGHGIHGYGGKGQQRYKVVWSVEPAMHPWGPTSTSPAQSPRLNPVHCYNSVSYTGESFV